MKVIVLAFVFLASTAAVAQIADPLPDPIVADGLTVRLLDWVQVPDSGEPAAPARVNLAGPAPDGSGRVFVNDQRGVLYAIENSVATQYLDLTAWLPNFLPETGYGTGFHSFAFHPDFALNGLLYTVHLEPPTVAAPDLVSAETQAPLAHSVITEWQASDSTAATFTGTRRSVLRIELPTLAHTVQEIAFNPTAVPTDTDYDLLYIGCGDGARLFTNNPQSLDSPHGSILRIDPLGNDSANGAYGIPQDNPYATDGDPSTLGEIWAFGLRNPHRFSWDPQGDHRMLIGDIGQNNIEEINLGAPGANYGWNVREGTFVFNKQLPFDVFALPPDDALNGYHYPVAQYDHDEGNAVVGGFVYRGALVPSLAGRYVFGDIVNGRLFHVAASDLVQGSQATISELSLVDATGTSVTLLELVDGDRADLRFGRTATGELLVLTKADGKVRRLVSALTPDSDGDGEPDSSDNCTLAVNADQRDTDQDGFGNLCDADLNNDGVINVLDLGLLKSEFFGSSPDADFDGDGAVNVTDLGILKLSYFGAPGPGAQQ
jgi:glucose/arabinose dehydrogenase